MRLFFVLLAWTTADPHHHLRLLSDGQMMSHERRAIMDKAAANEASYVDLAFLFDPSRVCALIKEQK